MCKCMCVPQISSFSGSIGNGEAAGQGLFRGKGQDRTRQDSTGRVGSENLGRITFVRFANSNRFSRFDRDALSTFYLTD